MDCAHCKGTMEGCASIKCSRCASQFHLECVSSEQLETSSNSWKCCNCLSTPIAPEVLEAIVRA